jgi:hypothetical protein
MLGTEMKHDLNNKKNNARRVATLAVLVATVVVVVVTGPATIILGINQSAYAITPDNDLNINIAATRKAPAVVTGENIYIAWWTDRGTPNTNGEVMFRASNDGGATFGNKTNLSNTDTVDSINAEIAAEGENVIVSWWETNQTSNIPVARISTDGGETFGPMLMLAANGTLTSTEEGGAEGDGGETTEEEAAVGGAEVAE